MRVILNQIFSEFGHKAPNMDIVKLIKYSNMLHCIFFNICTFETTY